MNSTNRMLIIFLILLFSILLIACDIAEILHEYGIFVQPVAQNDSPAEDTDPESKKQEEGQTVPQNKDEIDQCNANAYLSVENVQTMNELDESGAHMCQYTANIYNQHPDRNIWVFLFVHEEDGYQNTKSDSWFLGDLIFPNTIFEWRMGNASLRPNDKHFTGPTMRVAQKIAGVFDGEECRHLFTNTPQHDAYLEKIAVDLENGCPLE